ncbi:hypothetical protein [Teichococcus oryzae]|uniref:Uncharacterized protein n=1 Tax=Teichococcus oryzae TaxID=1608942 RepID=A0A5B2TBH6_9PROT|nr:hypothetical protein [Pseudoroseomonas oryzae]KAA2211405.1 hypothetical protein F0Q34_20260 [Pseudoroseomonas oryzae]
MNQERLAEIVRELLKEIGRARSEALAIRMVCGVLLGELVLKDSNPRLKMDHISALLSGSIHPSQDDTKKSSTGIIKTEAVNDIIEYAEKILAIREK